MTKQDALRIHGESLIIDGSFCRIHSPVPPTAETPDMLFEHIANSGVTAFNHTVIGDEFPTSFEGALMHVYEDSVMFDAFPERVMLVRGVADLEEAKRTGKVGVIFGTQGLEAVGKDMRRLWVLYSLGVRVMQLTYNEQNALGSGCRQPRDGGLTRSGQQAIEWMNRLGVVLDLSHVGRLTSVEAMMHTEQPPIVSHAGVQKLCDHPRNLTDEQITLLAKKDGVLGLCPHSVFVETSRRTRPTLSTFIDQIDYVASLVGVRHIGIGTDNFTYDTYFGRLGNYKFERTYPGFFGGYGIDEKHVRGFSRWSDWINLTEALLERGYSEEDARGILGGNFLRVFTKVWKG
ncbi:MAG: membrane dipeptidase [Candidatus Bipolaricaulis sp.]|nr:membrane dipeptidase [Candidatus Bipolaricaulis sp.]